MNAIAFAAVLGYASAGLIAPVVYGATAGDVQGAIIDATVAARERIRILEDKQALVDEHVLRTNNKAIRQAAETSRFLQEKAYWGSVTAAQNYVAAAQSRAAALSGAAASVRATPVVHAVAPLAYAGYGFPAAYGLGLHAR